MASLGSHWLAQSTGGVWYMCFEDHFGYCVENGVLKGEKLKRSVGKRKPDGTF